MSVIAELFHVYLMHHEWMRMALAMPMAAYALAERMQLGSRLTFDHANRVGAKTSSGAFRPRRVVNTRPPASARCRSGQASPVTLLHKTTRIDRRNGVNMCSALRKRLPVVPPPEGLT